MDDPIIDKDDRENAHDDANYAMDDRNYAKDGLNYAKDGSNYAMDNPIIDTFCSNNACNWQITRMFFGIICV